MIWINTLMAVRLKLKALSSSVDSVLLCCCVLLIGGSAGTMLEALHVVGGEDYSGNSFGCSWSHHKILCRFMISDQSQLDSEPPSPVMSKKGIGLSVVVRKPAMVASVAAKHAYAAASSSSSNFDEMIPLKCSLMSILMPWEYIAYDLLFKGAPPVITDKF